jgi:hypothetical protein
MAIGERFKQAFLEVSLTKRLKLQKILTSWILGLENRSYNREDARIAGLFKRTVPGVVHVGVLTVKADHG